MQKGLYKILFIKRNKLYVEINKECVQVFDIPNGLIYNEFIELIKIKDIYYIKGTEPKEIKKEKVYTKEIKKDE